MFDDLSHPQLPIDEILPELLRSVSANRNVLLHAPPGAGKSTRVPLALLDVINPEAGRILMLEPRRLAAVSVAGRMADTLGEEVGEAVGYSIRFDSRVSRATRIEVVTEGILTRRIQNDPLLEGVALVIFDEFHERSIHADLGLALCLDVQKQVRPDLKILIMSATLDIGSLSAILEDAPVISSFGRMFPVEELYIENMGQGKLPQRMSAAVIRALNENEGDILAFLPGSGEIRNCAGLLAGAGLSARGITVHQLYGDLPFAEQQRALVAGSGRKIVLATSIAETSLTIDGVRIVIDSGLSRRLQFDPSSGMNRLVTIRESRASAEQRRGRGGRQVPGVCYRLYSRHTFTAMTPHTPPEILEADLSPLLLELAAWGTADPSTLKWLDPPPEAALRSARNLLEDLSALDSSGRITPLGRAMTGLPLHPRISRLLLRSVETECSGVGCDLAALLSERDILRRSPVMEYGASDHYDPAERIDTLRGWRSSGNVSTNIDISALKSVDRVARQLRRFVNSPVERPGLVEIDRLLLAAYPDRIGKLRDTAAGRYLLANGRGADIRGAVINSGQFIVAVSVDGGTTGDGVIRNWTEVTEELLREELAERIEQRDSISWDVREGRVAAFREERFGAIPLTSRPFMPERDSLLPVVLDAIRNSGVVLLNLDEEFRQLQGRVLLLKRFFPEEEWPDFSDGALTESLEIWLAPSIQGFHNARQLGSVNCAAALFGTLDYRQKLNLEKLAPTHLVVPSGSRIRLDYTAGDMPLLAVKLQELFGLAETPAVAGGRAPLLLHLLSPAGRPLQVTGDLKGFWDGSYHQVKKEMKGRYPKHPWPDDPWSALPTRRAKPRGSQ